MTRSPLRAKETNEKNVVVVDAVDARTGVVRYGRDRSKRGRARGGGTKTTTEDEGAGTTTTDGTTGKTMDEGKGEGIPASDGSERGSATSTREEATKRGLEIAREGGARERATTRRGVGLGRWW